MPIKNSCHINQKLASLQQLIRDYRQYPNLSLAKTVNFYLHELNSELNSSEVSQEVCDYLHTLKFWRWYFQAQLQLLNHQAEY